MEEKTGSETVNDTQKFLKFLYSLHVVQKFLKFQGVKYKISYKPVYNKKFVYFISSSGIAIKTVSIRFIVSFTMNMGDSTGHNMTIDHMNIFKNRNSQQKQTEKNVKRRWL